MRDWNSIIWGDGESQSFVDTSGGSPTYRWGKIIGVIGGGLLAVLFSIPLRLIDVLVGVNLWVIDGIAAFLYAVLVQTFRLPADAQIQAWRTAFRETVQFGVFQPWILLFEGLIVVGLIAVLRRRWRVLP